MTRHLSRRRCQCMDFRIRQRECKHIRLVLQQLGIAKHPQDWHKVQLYPKICSTVVRTCCCAILCRDICVGMSTDMAADVSKIAELPCAVCHTVYIVHLRMWLLTCERRRHCTPGDMRCQGALICCLTPLLWQCKHTEASTRACCITPSVMSGAGASPVDPALTVH